MSSQAEKSTPRMERCLDPRQVATMMKCKVNSVGGLLKRMGVEPLTIHGVSYVHIWRGGHERLYRLRDVRRVLRQQQAALKESPEMTRLRRVAERQRVEIAKRDAEIARLKAASPATPPTPSK